MKKIILASQSAGRRKVLEEMGVPFEVIVSDFVENMQLVLPPKELAVLLSRGKAQAVFGRWPESLVIGADTFVVHEGKLIGKPKDDDHARDILSSLSGKRHEVLTGMTVIDDTKAISKTVSTFVTMKPLSPADIDAYIATGDHIGRAAAYGIQGKGKDLVESIEGEYSNVMGLPAGALADLLAGEFGVQIDRS